MNSNQTERRIPNPLIAQGVAGLILCLLPHTAIGDPNAKEIMTKNEDVRRVQDVRSTATLSSGKDGKVEKSKHFTWWRKLTPDGTHFNTLTRFHAPAEIRGEGILFLEKSADDNEVLLYLPNFKKIRRIETQNQSGSFMSSEFSYSDISTPHVDDYDYKFLRTEACPMKENAGITCWVIEAKPKTEAIKTRTGYSRTVQWVRQDNWMGVRAETFDADDKPWKEMESTQIKLVDAEKKKWMAHHVHILNLRNKKFTSLEFKDVAVNKGIEDNVFTQTNLMKDR